MNKNKAYTGDFILDIWVVIKGVDFKENKNTNKVESKIRIKCIKEKFFGVPRH